MEDDAESVMQYTKELADEIATIEGFSHHPPEWKDFALKEACTPSSTPFFTTDSSSFVGCFITCEFVDFCEMLAYVPEEGVCHLYHVDSATWEAPAQFSCWKKGMA